VFKHCIECGFKLKKGHKFCQNCGANIPKELPEKIKYCPDCGNKIKENHKFCDACGFKIPEPEEEIDEILGQPEGEVDSEEKNIDNQEHSDSNHNSGGIEPEKPKTKNTIYYVIGLIFFVICLIAAGMYVFINEPPHASINATPMSGYASLDVSFKASGSYDDDGQINDYYWSFGDGKHSSSSSIKHTFERSGSYNVKLTVTDNEGETDSVSVTIKVYNSAPKASFTTSMSDDCAPVTVSFQASGSSDDDGYIAGYRWDWTNDGNWDTSWSSSSTTTHIFSNKGTYTIKLEVKDDEGSTDTYSKTIVIKTFDSDGDGCCDDEDINKYGDGKISFKVTYVDCDEDADPDYVIHNDLPDIKLSITLYVESENGDKLDTINIFEDTNWDEVALSNPINEIINVDDCAYKIRGTIWAYDDDSIPYVSTSYETIDINSMTHEKSVSFEFYPRLDSSKSYSNNGRLDYVSDEIDGQIHFEIGVTS